MTGQPAAQPATPELLALAARTRPDDVDLRDLEGVIAEAMEAGKSWGVVMVQTVRMLAHPEENIRDLRIALTDPLRQRPENRRRTHL